MCNLYVYVSAAGVVTTLLGSGAVATVDGAGTSASLNDPQGIAIDTSGNLYFADNLGFRIRKLWTIYGASACTNCAAGTYSTTASATNPSVCIACATNFISLAGATACYPL